MKSDLILLFTLSICFLPECTAQQSTMTQPVVGLRDADPSPVLLEGAEVVCRPESTPQPLSILIAGNRIAQVGNNIVPPPGTERRDMTGMRIYAGFIDAMHEVELPEGLPTEPDRYWNQNITPEHRAVWFDQDRETELRKLRSQGITAQLLAPKNGIIKGTSCIVLTLDRSHPQHLLRSDAAGHLTLTVPRGQRRDRYPNSPMGAVALVRQAFYDAIWYRDAYQVYANDRQVPRPQPNRSLELLSQWIDSGTFVIDAANERMAIRASDLAKEFSLNMIVRGSGYEYCELSQIASSGHPILLPVDFPDKPATRTLESIRETPLRTWMHWHFAPENPGRLHQAGVPFCLTSDGLGDPSTFLKQVRVAVERGLDKTAALSAMTTVPANLLELDDAVGKIEAGMFANLVVTDGELFAKDTKVVETWVAGERFSVEKNAIPKQSDALAGTWSIVLPSVLSNTKQSTDAELIMEKASGKTTAQIRWVNAETETQKVLKLSDIVRSRARLSASAELSKLSDSFAEGVSKLTLLIGSNEKSISFVRTTLTLPDGREVDCPIRRKETATKEVDDAPSPSDSTDSEPTNSKATQPVELVYPLGAYGLSEIPDQPNVVLFRGATVWTSGELGPIQNGDVLVIDGRVADVGSELAVPAGGKVINLKGKHLTPGLIDCHSHIATDGGINESGQAITSEVRIGDFIDNSDIAIYRQLAGGVTTSNILHGSANPIGGQNQVLKLRWGASMDAMKFASAPAGIKFALGENVKRSSGRYPNTRMGVEQIIRDQFLAAREYDAEQKAWQSGRRQGLPPRRNLQLEAIAEIQRGERWVHCHSYRQDEILATLDVLEEFNVQIGSLQHISEGYKVADRIAEHGAMASAFADWWAYKFEVYDAIPYNGVILHNAGVIVSYNSDDAELGRHLNVEAGKAMKYGGLSAEQALAFVTLNPAKQLRIDDRVGSIEKGKDADLVVWSGPPLSAASRCEQTWIDGRCYFDLTTDKQLRERDRSTRAKLVQLAQRSPEKPNSQPKKEKEIEEADRWDRVDIYCRASAEKGASR
ncbi:isoaspartyl dipeptidase [Novipirellula aureliae]|uniref:Isoaspartyl dipeptidase n=1 Tax=Novipirellula aureliae TaxID=2527966 RepID=A0A5C6EB74_9BACT|nr:amidohydrolase family protein [Novipirellula aureliae]TWU45177.1 isoaspartyl dipeptidase [Novipirellula aureliae]